jgi:hypothetical protein
MREVVGYVDRQRDDEDGRGIKVLCRVTKHQTRCAKSGDVVYKIKHLWLFFFVTGGSSAATIA